MVTRILKVFHQEFSGLHKAALILASSSAASSLLGLLRDRLLAGNFGAGRSLDIYYAAFKIPDFLYTFLLSVVSVTVLIPFFLEKISFSKEKGRAFLNNTFTFFSLIAFVLGAAVFFFIPYLSAAVAPGFSVEDQRQLVSVTKILLFSPLLLGLSNLFSSVTQSYNRFFIYALSPIFYNLGIILGIIFFLPVYGINGVAIGVVLGAFMHFVIQIPIVAKLGFFPTISLNSLKINFDETWKVIKLSFHRTFGLSLNQLVFVFVTAIASFLGAGSIAVFNLSFNLQSGPLAVIGVSYGAAAFPTLAKFFVNNQKKEFVEHTVSAIRQIVFWSIPAAMMIIVLRAQIVRIVLGSSERFDWQDTRLTAAALALFAVSVTAQSLIILLVRSFYAAGKTWKPTFINAGSSVFIILLSFWIVKSVKAPLFFKDLFESILRVEGVRGTDMLVLPLIFSSGMILNVIFLFFLFQKEFGDIWVFVRKAFFQVLTASFLMSAVCYFFLGVLTKIFDINTFIGIFSQGLISAVLGGGVWYFILRLMGNRELEEIVISLKQKFWRTPVIAPEPEVLDR